MAIYPAVIGYRDGEEYKLNADELNRPIKELVARTDWLKSRVDQVVSSDGFSSLEFPNVELHEPENLLPGMPVYIRPEDGKYAAATASALAAPAYSYTYIDTEGFAVGVLKSISGNFGTITAYGKLNLSAIDVNTLMATGETFRPGPYYLSDEEPGKYTKAPTGPAVYMGFMQSSQMVVSPQLKDFFEAHLHRSFILKDRPAGSIRVTGVDENSYVYDVAGFRPDYYQPGELGELDIPAVLLNVRGTYSGPSTTEFTFWLSSTLGQVATARIHWTTDDGSDENLVGVVIGAFESPVDLGNGLIAIIEKGDPDWSAEDFDTLTVGVEQEPETTWTIPTFGETIRGWAAHKFREIMSYDGTGLTPSDCGLKIVGKNIIESHTRTITVAPSAPGDLATGVVFSVWIDGVGPTATPALSVGQAFELVQDLWLIVTDGTVTTVTTDDQWTVTFYDPAPLSQFEYLTSLDAEMAAYYPPDSRLKLVFETNGVTLASRDEFRENEGSYLADKDTVYWWGDTHRGTPFPHDYVDLDNPGEYQNAKNLKLYGTELRAADTGLVTSLVAEEGSSVEVVDAITGNPASTGNLKVRASFNVSVEETNKAGYNVVKGVNAEGALVSGPVVEQILAGDNIILTPLESSPAGQGRIRVSAALSGLTRAMFTDVILHNAKQELVPNSGIPYVKLKGWVAGGNNVPSGFTMKFRVPYGLTGKYKVGLFFTMFGLSEVAVGSSPGSQKYAGLKITYSIVQDFVNTTSPDTPTLITRNLKDLGVSGVLQGELVVQNDVPFGALDQGYVAYDPFLLHNDVSLTPVSGQVVGPFGDTAPKLGDDPAYVTAGDIVSIRIDRQAPLVHAGVAEYRGEIGFVANEWKLMEV